MAFDFDVATDRGGTDSIKCADDGLIAMGLADMDFPTAPVVLEALEARVAHGVFGYTGVGPGVLAAVTEWLSSRNRGPVESEWITICPGIMPSMAHLLRGVLAPGSGVIVQTPGFDPIRTVIEANGFQYVENPLSLRDGRYHMDLDGFRAVASRHDVEAFVLCSPHNPMGRVWSRAELEEVARICESEDLLVISDEIHAEVIFPGAQFTPYGAVAEPDARHATLLGPSKGFNLAGLRTAVAIIPDHELRSLFRHELHRVNEDFGVSVMGVVALRAAFSGGAGWLDALTEYLHENVGVLRGELEKEFPMARVVEPEASFLVWIDVRDLRIDDHEIVSRILEQGVVVEPGRSFGEQGVGFIRVNIGTSRARLVEAVSRIGLALR